MTKSGLLVNHVMLNVFNKISKIGLVEIMPLMSLWFFFCRAGLMTKSGLFFCFFVGRG